MSTSKSVARSSSRSQDEKSLHATPILPIECLIEIVQLVNFDDVKNFRLVCSLWAAAGTVRLFEDGVVYIKPHRNDTELLASLAKCEWFASRIRHVKLYAGDTHVDKWALAIDLKKRELYRRYSEPRRRDRNAGDTIRSCLIRYIHYTTGKALKALEYLETECQSWEHQHCRNDILCSAFSNLRCVTTVTVTSAEFPFMKESGLLRYFWDFGICYPERDFLDFQDLRKATRVYASVLGAANFLKSPILQLTLDRMPIDYPSAFNSLDSPLIFPAMNKVRSLKIQFPFYFLEIPDKNILLGRNFSRLLASTEHLESLDWTSSIGFAMGVTISNPFRTFFWSSFWVQNHPWSQLQSLRLHITKKDPEQWISMLPLILQHHGHLRTLHICEHSSASDEDYNSLLREIGKISKKLEKIELLVEADSPRKMSRIYNEDWSERDRGEGHPIRRKCVKLLEQYALGKCEWPMTSRAPRDGRWVLRRAFR